MPVYIVCDQCQKRLKIPDNVVGHSIKCPACHAVFLADAAKVQPAAQPVHTAALAEEDEILPARKKADAVGDEAVAPKPHKHVVEPVEEDDEPPPARRRRRADDYDEDDYDDEEEEARARTPWYVMLPLLVLSFGALGVALLWPIGFSWLAPGLDHNLSTLGFDGRMWIGITAGIVLTLLCLIVSLIGARSWLRFVVVLLLLAIGYGGSFAAANWWKDLPFGKDTKPATQPRPMPMPGQNGAPE